MLMILYFTQLVTFSFVKHYLTLWYHFLLLFSPLQWPFLASLHFLFSSGCVRAPEYSLLGFLSLEEHTQCTWNWECCTESFCLYKMSHFRIKGNVLECFESLLVLPVQATGILQKYLLPVYRDVYFWIIYRFFLSDQSGLVCCWPGFLPTAQLLPDFVLDMIC